MALHRPLPSLLLLALLGAACVTAPVAAQGRKPPVDPAARTAHGAWPASADSHRRSEDALSDSIRRIERTTRGQVLSAERVPYEGRSLNRIKVVDQRGRVRVYMDDPRAVDPRVDDTRAGDAVSQPPRRSRGNGRTPTRGDDD